MKGVDLAMNHSNVKSTTKKRAKAVLSVFLVVAILIAGAYAFLSATDSKTNVFTVGNVDIELHEIFNGKDYGKGEDPGAIGDKIENIVPGQSIEKAPYVVNTGKNPAYTFIAVGIPTDTSANVYNGQGTYTAKTELDIKVKAYAIQQQYNGATDAESTWTNYFKNDMISGTASDAGIELFTLNDGTSAVTTGTHTIGSDWQEFSTPYSVTDGGNTYTYHFFKYVANNELLPVGTTTAHLFDKVIFNENIGGDTPPEPYVVNFLIKEDSSTTLSGITNLNTNISIPEGYNVFKSQEIMPGESIKMPLDNSLMKDNYCFDWVDIDTKESGYSNMRMPNRNINFVATYRKLNTDNVLPTNANFLSYRVDYNEAYGGLYATLVTRTSFGATDDESIFPQVPDSIDYIAIPNNITITINDYRDNNSIYYGAYGAVFDTDWKIYDTIHANNQIQSLQIPVKEISSLWELRNATTICLPDNVVKIKDATNMPNLEKINIPYACTQIGTVYDGNSCSSGFYGCSKLNNVVLPNTLEIIGQNAFYGTDVKDITIPNSVKIIDYCAFQSSKLTSVTFGNSLEEIGDMAFSSVPLETIDFSSAQKLKRIGDQAFFSSCQNSFSLLIPDSVIKIGDSAFSYTGVTDLTIGAQTEKLGKSAFEGCQNLTNVTIPESVSNIEDNVFYSCSSLVNVTLPNSITKIGDYAFGNCQSLQNITIPNSVMNIGNNTFYLSDNLTITISQATYNSIIANNAQAFNDFNGSLNVI